MNGVFVTLRVQLGGGTEAMNSLLNILRDIFAVATRVSIKTGVIDTKRRTEDIQALAGIVSSLVVRSSESSLSEVNFLDEKLRDRNATLQRVNADLEERVNATSRSIENIKHKITDYLLHGIEPSSDTEAEATPTQAEELQCVRDVMAALSISRGNGPHPPPPPHWQTKSSSTDSPSGSPEPGPLLPETSPVLPPPPPSIPGSGPPPPPPPPPPGSRATVFNRLAGMLCRTPRDSLPTPKSRTLAGGMKLRKVNIVECKTGTDKEVELIERSIFVQHGIIKASNEINFEVESVGTLFNANRPVSTPRDDTIIIKSISPLADAAPETAKKIAIITRSSKLPLETMIEAIKSLDGKVLNKDQVYQLMHVAPTAEQVAIVKKWTGDPNLLAEADRFVLGMSAIPHLQGRLASWYSMLDFDAMLSDIRSDIDSVILAAKELQQHELFPKFLGLVLAVLNLFNQKAVYAFKMASLTKLKDTKDVDNKTNLLDFLIRFMGGAFGEQSPEIKQLLTFVDHRNLADLVARALRVSFPALYESISQLKTSIKNVRGTFETIQRSNAEGREQFVATIGGFLKLAEPEVANFDTKIPNMEKLLKDVAVLFNEPLELGNLKRGLSFDGGQNPSGNFSLFADLGCFFTEYRAALKAQIEQRVKLNRLEESKKKLQIRQQQQQQQSASSSSAASQPQPQQQGRSHRHRRTDLGGQSHCSQGFVQSNIRAMMKGDFGVLDLPSRAPSENNSFIQPEPTNTPTPTPQNTNGESNV